MHLVKIMECTDTSFHRITFFMSSDYVFMSLLLFIVAHIGFNCLLILVLSYDNM